MSNNYNTLIQFIKEPNEEVEFGKIDVKDTSICHERYGSEFDYLKVELFYRKNYEKVIDGAKHYECQVIITRNKLTLVDGEETMAESLVYRGYFDVLEEHLTPDTVISLKRDVIMEVLTLPAIVLWHGYVDKLSHDYRDYKTFQELRESVGVHLFMQQFIPGYESSQYVFKEDSMVFDSADEEGECIVSVEVDCRVAESPDGDRTGYFQWIEFIAKHKDYTSTLKLSKFSAYPYLDITKVYAENKALIKARLGVK